MIPFYKRLGETPLQALDRLRIEQPQFQNETLSYAGRLDPMAEGLLLVLVGDENNHRETFLHLSKIYKAEMILGIETDSFDLLGKITNISDTAVNSNVEEIQKITAQYKDIFTQEYPPFSSKPVNGKPLFVWAKEGKLETIKIPSKKVEIFDIEVTKVDAISTSELQKALKNKVNLVNGDFRQQDILEDWQQKLENKDRQWTRVGITISCSSGTYVRAIINSIGKQLKLGATTYSILRTKIGDFFL